MTLSIGEGVAETQQILAKALIQNGLPPEESVSSVSRLSPMSRTILIWNSGFEVWSENLKYALGNRHSGLSAPGGISDYRAFWYFHSNLYVMSEDLGISVPKNMSDNFIPDFKKRTVRAKRDEWQNSRCALFEARNDIDKRTDNLYLMREGVKLVESQALYIRTAICGG